MIRKPNVLAIMSPKGGVGKTVTTANLAAVLAEKLNKKVLAIDTNVSTASLGLHFNVLYPKVTINQIIEKKIQKSKLIHEYSENLHIIPASIQIKKKTKNPQKMVSEIQKIIEEYEKLLEGFYKDYDLILLDCAPGFDIEAIATMNVAGGLLIVTNPEYPSVASAVKSIEYAKHSKMPVGGIILTKVRGKRHELTKKEIENALKIKVVQEIPYDKAISESINKRMPLVLLRPYSKAARAYKKLAQTIIGYKKEGFLQKIKNKFSRSKNK